MRKILCIMSIVCNGFLLFVLATINSPKLVDYDEGIGFLVTFLSIAFSGLVLLIWSIFSAKKSDKNKKLQIIASIAFVIHTILFSNMYFDFLHIGAELIVVQIAIAIISLSLCTGYSKKAIDN